VVLGAVEAKTGVPWLILDVVATATWWVFGRLDWTVARGLVKNDLETGQGGECRWREGVKRVKTGKTAKRGMVGVGVEDDESVGRI
jgi:hypothetical protein